MTLRSCIRAAAVCASVPLVLLSTTPAFAYIRDDGDDPGPGLTVLETIGIYVVVPVLIFLLITGLALLPSMVRKQRYRPGQPWPSSPAVFAGATQAPAPSSGASADTTPEGGSSREGGGASARW